MCYNVEYLTKKAEEYGQRYSLDIASIQAVMTRLGTVNQVNAFLFPQLPVIWNDQQNVLSSARWGLIPHWASSEQKAKEIRSKTLNARAESIFDRPSYSKAIMDQRCILLLDGFFEYHHLGGKSFPFYIKRKDGSPMAIAAVYDRWNFKDKDGAMKSARTVSMITYQANPILAQIHNKATLKAPRMPLILENDTVKDWHQAKSKSDIQDFFQVFSEEKLTAHTVRTLPKSNYEKDNATIKEQVTYPVIGLPLF